MVVEGEMVVVAGMELRAEDIESTAVLMADCAEVDGAGVLVLIGVTVAAGEELPSAVEVATFVTVVVVVVDVVGTDVRAELVETDCVVDDEEEALSWLEPCWWLQWMSWQEEPW